MNGDRAMVFIAEDDPHLRALLEIVVRRAGHAVTSCASGVELLERLRAAAVLGDLPDLVVSDNRMPGLAGMQVIADVRGWGLAVPFVLLTAFPDDVLLASATRLAVSAVVSKPVTLGALTRLIDAHVQLRLPRGCPICGEPTAGGACEDCEPTRRHGRAADPDDGYLDLGGSD